VALAVHCTVLCFIVLYCVILHCIIGNYELAINRDMYFDVAIGRGANGGAEKEHGATSHSSAIAGD
jgi:hypothetical protein